MKKQSKDRLLYVSRCKCGELGAVVEKAGKKQFYCMSCGRLMGADSIGAGQLWTDVYPDYHRGHVVSILKRIDPKFDCKPTINSVSYTHLTLPTN